MKDFTFYYIGTLWTVKFTSDEKLLLVEDDKGMIISLNGICDSDTNQIIVRNTLCDINIIKTLFHEIFHCILSPIALSAPNLDEEQTVELLAHAMVEILPQLPKEILKVVYEYRENMLASLTLQFKKKRK